MFILYTIEFIINKHLKVYYDRLTRELNIIKIKRKLFKIVKREIFYHL